MIEPNCQIVLTWSDLVAIYAAAIATLVGVVEVFRFFREIRNKLVVGFFANHHYPISSGKEMGNPYEVMTLTVVNHSMVTKFIKTPGMDVNKGGQKYSLINFNNPVNYPVRLGPGETFETYFDIDSIRSKLHEVGATKYRAIIFDSLGNRFYSKWVKT